MHFNNEAGRSFNMSKVRRNKQWQAQDGNLSLRPESVLSTALDRILESQGY